MPATLSRRSLLAFGLGAVAVGALAGCTGDDDSGTADLSGKTTGAMSAFGVNQQFKATKPLTISMLFQDNPAYPQKSSWQLWSEITKLSNVTLDPTIVPFADYTTKQSLLINSGNAPAIIAKTYPGSESQFVGGGAVIAASDYVKYMPNFTAKVKQWKLDAEIDTLRQADGKFYLFPGVHETLFVDYTLAARTDVLEKQGLAVPASFDELRTTLQALKTAYPSVQYPFSDRFTASNILGLAGTTWGTTSGWGLTNGLMWDTTKKRFFFAPATDEFKEMLSYFAGLVSDGLMDPASFTQSDDQAVAKFTTGKSFFISTNAQTLQLYRSTMDSSLGKGKYTIAKIPSPAGPLGKVIGGSRLENGIMISTSATKQPDFKALLQFVDWLWYSDIGQVFVKWGVEGTTYSESGGRYTLEPGYKFTAYGLGDASAKTDIRTDLGYGCGNFAYGGSTALVDSTMNDEELAWQKIMSTYTQLPAQPSVPYTTVQRQQATLQQTSLIDAVNTATLNFILGKQSIASGWSTYLAALKSKGMATFVDNANRYYADA